MKNTPQQPSLLEKYKTCLYAELSGRGTIYIKHETNSNHIDNSGIHVLR